MHHRRSGAGLPVSGALATLLRAPGWPELFLARWAGDSWLVPAAHLSRSTGQVTEVWPETRAQGQVMSQIGQRARQTSHRNGLAPNVRLRETSYIATGSECKGHQDRFCG